MPPEPDTERREVVVYGTPVSLQSKTNSARQKWIERVRAAARDFIEEGEQLDVFNYPNLRVWVVYFHFGEMAGDLDNIAKPILDGMSGPGWTDDRQIAWLTLRRIRLDPPENEQTSFLNPPLKVQNALRLALPSQQDFVYIRAEPDTTDQRIP